MRYAKPYRVLENSYLYGYYCLEMCCFDKCCNPIRKQGLQSHSQNKQKAWKTSFTSNRDYVELLHITYNVEPI